MYILIIIVFIIGYAAIAFEHPLKINKTASALLTGVLCWTVYVLYSTDSHLVSEKLIEHLGEISGILFFLLGAMTIVELIDAHDGFDVISNRITTTSKKKLLWVISIITFFLAPIVDNLAAAIIMVTLLRKILTERQDRLLFVGMIVIAANAGGAWSPLGAVTTTMLWIGGQVSFGNAIVSLILPSSICLIVSTLAASTMVKGEFVRIAVADKIETKSNSTSDKNLIFFLGMAALLFVPVFKGITGLPPFMGMLFSLGVLWIITEIIHKRKHDQLKEELSVMGALQRIDVPTILFFLGILIAVSSLEVTGQLAQMAAWMDKEIGNLSVIVMAIGILSAIVDNVPLVAACQGMYDLNVYPIDHFLWEFIAYCAGTGGSMLIIGSAAGVAVMGMEKIDFIWYMKKIGWIAAVGYFAGAAVYILQEKILL